LSAYRKGYSCQHVILQLTESWRKALDDKNYVGCLAMDLSKAFDNMPHGLLVAKLHAYGISREACMFLISYLRNRRQRVKVCGQVSDWNTINRGVPQGSVMGPLLFNIFINDLFYVDMYCKIANYADDNHLYCHNKCITKLQDTIEKDIGTATTWFQDNHMDANPEKFQCILLGGEGKHSVSLSFKQKQITSTNNIKVLGVTLDNKLNFKLHVTQICQRASRQINALKRISKFFNTDRRLLIYKSFIYGNFSYCPVTWLFCGKVNSNRLEKIQERALRYVFSDYSSPYDVLLTRGNLLPLSLYRLRFLALELYKCVNGLNPNYLNELFMKHSVNYNLRDNNLLLQPKFRTTRFGLKSFRYIGAKLWNELPLKIKESKNLNTFKRNISEWCKSPAAKKFTALF
jgi:hypothetical protein